MSDEALNSHRDVERTSTMALSGMWTDLDRDDEVENGVLTLTGWVRTWLEKQSIIGAAGHAPGIRDVVDRLQVDPYK